MTAVPPLNKEDKKALAPRFNPSKEMTAVPPSGFNVERSCYTEFQPLKGNDGRAALRLLHW